MLGETLENFKYTLNDIKLNSFYLLLFELIHTHLDHLKKHTTKTRLVVFLQTLRLPL